MPQDAAAELCIDSLAQGGKFMCGISRIKQEKSLHLGLEIVDFFFFLLLKTALLTSDDP